MTVKSGRREKRFSPLIIRQPFSKPMTMILPPFKQRVKLASTQSINIMYLPDEVFETIASKIGASCTGCDPAAI